MNSVKRMFCQPVNWNGRKGYVLGNSVVRMTTLTGGGHISDFRLEQSPVVNPLWTPPWKTIDPQSYREKIHASKYGTITEGKLLSGIVGHNICLDYFGSPSTEEAQFGLSQHGEAPSSRWRKAAGAVTQQRVALTLEVNLPVAGLKVSRIIELRKDESVAYVTEVVENRRKADHFFHWTQHVTLGTPFLTANDSMISLPGTRGYTGDEGTPPLLAAGEEFEWPNAPSATGGLVDLTSPLIRDGFSFLVAILLDKRRDVAFIAAVNRKLGLLLAYCFRRQDFPWVAIWEENRAIKAPPWNGMTQARGLEFSTTPLPLLRRDSFLFGRLFDEPTLACIPARATKKVRYLALLARVPHDFETVQDIEVGQHEMKVQGSRGQVINVPASATAHLAK
jgi:hypothetical protein